MNTPIKDAIHEFLDKLALTGHETKDIQLVLPLRTLANLWIEIKQARLYPLDPSDLVSIQDLKEGEIQLRMQTGTVTLKALD